MIYVSQEHLCSSHQGWQFGNADEPHWPCGIPALAAETKNRRASTSFRSGKVLLTVSLKVEQY